jgi:alginate O-acetyltransferase complex protein AlgI
MFPQLIAGPIVQYSDIEKQLNERVVTREKFTVGIIMFFKGLGKKVLFANTIGAFYTDIIAMGTAKMSTATAWIGIICYTLQIYFDFSGYCDMAIGIGRMMNIDLPVNFDSPYKALTITEFWQRWHKTLTRFFTRYIYIPLGGNRKGQMRTYVNIMIVYLASGIWHGASWSFVIWGVLHGIFCVITRHWSGWFRKLHPAFSWMITFLFVSGTWILFRAERIMDAVVFLKQLLIMEFGPIRQEVIGAFFLPELQFLLEKLPFLGFLEQHPGIWLLAVYSGAMTIILSAGNAHQRMEEFRPRLSNLIGTLLLMIWCILSFSGVSTFLYFNF